MLPVTVTLPVTLPVTEFPQVRISDSSICHGCTDKYRGYTIHVRLRARARRACGGGVPPKIAVTAVTGRSEAIFCRDKPVTEAVTRRVAVTKRGVR